MEAIQNNRWEAQQKFSNDRSLLDKAQSLIEEKNKVIDRLITKVRNVELEHNERSTEEKYLNKKMLEQEKIVNKADTKLSNARISLSDFSEELNRLTMDIHSKKSKLTFLKDQLSFSNFLLMLFR